MHAAFGRQCCETHAAHIQLELPVDEPDRRPCQKVGRRLFLDAAGDQFNGEPDLPAGIGKGAGTDKGGAVFDVRLCGHVDLYEQSAVRHGNAYIAVAIGRFQLRLEGEFAHLYAGCDRQHVIHPAGRRRGYVGNRFVIGIQIAVSAILFDQFRGEVPVCFDPCSVDEDAADRIARRHRNADLCIARFGDRNRFVRNAAIAVRRTYEHVILPADAGIDRERALGVYLVREQVTVLFVEHDDHKIGKIHLIRARQRAADLARNVVVVLYVIADGAGKRRLRFAVIDAVVKGMRRFFQLRGAARIRARVPMPGLVRLQRIALLMSGRVDGYGFERGLRRAVLVGVVLFACFAIPVLFVPLCRAGSGLGGMILHIVRRFADDRIRERDLRRAGLVGVVFFARFAIPVLFVPLCRAGGGLGGNMLQRMGMYFCKRARSLLYGRVAFFAFRRDLFQERANGIVFGGVVFFDLVYVEKMLGIIRPEQIFRRINIAGGVELQAFKIFFPVAAKRIRAVDLVPDDVIVVGIGKHRLRPERRDQQQILRIGGYSVFDAAYCRIQIVPAGRIVRSGGIRKAFERVFALKTDFGSVRNRAVRTAVFQTAGKRIACMLPAVIGTRRGKHQQRQNQ